MKKGIIIILILLVIAGGVWFLVSHNNADTKDTVQMIEDSGKLKIGLESGFEPFEYQENGNVVGIDIDIANEIAKSMGVTVDVQDMDFDSVLAAVTSGSVDLGVSGISKTEEREQSMDFSDSYFETNQLIVVKKDNDSIKGKDDLNGKTIGAQTGTTGETLANEISGADVKGYDTYAEAVLDLKNGKLDAIIMDQYPAKANVQTNSDSIKVLDEPLGTDSYCIAVKKGNAELLDKVNEVLKEMKADGTLDQIINKYISALEAE